MTLDIKSAQVTRLQMLMPIQLQSANGTVSSHAQHCSATIDVYIGISHCQIFCKAKLEVILPLTSARFIGLGPERGMTADPTPEDAHRLAQHESGENMVQD